MHRISHSALSGLFLNDMKKEFTDLFVEALEDFEGGEVEFFTWARALIFGCGSWVLSPFDLLNNFLIVLYQPLAHGAQLPCRRSDAPLLWLG